MIFRITHYLCLYVGKKIYINSKEAVLLRSDLVKRLKYKELRGKKQEVRVGCD